MGSNLICPPNLHLDISHEHISEVKVKMESVGFDCWETSVGSRGVSLHCCI